MSKSKIKVVLNKDQIGLLLKSQDMENLLKNVASNIQSRCGEGYGIDTKLMGTRVIASVKAESASAARDNSENNTILKECHL